MRVFIFISLIIITQAVWAQFEKDYKPIVSQGALPKDFVTLSADKYEADKASIKAEKKKERKSKEKFLLQSNFSLDEVLLSGKVVFNDQLADYVNKVADKALVSEPALRGQLRFYILKSTAVNAFATNQGVVFVTMGLLAQLENEAQLAFILCHEAMHYKEQHAIEKYLESEKIEKGKEAYKQLTAGEQFLSKCAFSKEQETEADNKGIEVFLKSQYSTANLLGVYDVLKYSYLPFDDVTFDKGFLENATMKIPDEYYKKNTLAIETRDIDDDDTRSTHPSIKARRSNTALHIKDTNDSNKGDYLVGEQLFKNCREAARFELCRLYTLKRRYESGIYTSYMLLKKYPENIYLKKNIAYCLAGLAQYSIEGEFYDVHYNSDSIEGKSQALFYLMFKLDSVRGDLPVVALAYTAGLKKAYPRDRDIDALYKNLVTLLVTKQNKKLSDFSDRPYTPELQIADTAGLVARIEETPEETEGKSKYEKLREQHAREEKGIIKPKAYSAHFTTYAFVDLMKEDWFKEAFNEAYKEKDKAEKEKIDLDDARSSGRRRYWDKRTYTLGVKKIVIVDPYYARINARKKDKYKYLKSEYGQIDFAERLNANARKAKVDIEVLNTKNLKENETGKINEIALMNEYIAERLQHGNSIEMPFAERERVMAIAEKYGTDHFMWTGTISLTDKNRFNPLMIMYSILLPPVLPFTLPALINGGQYTIYFAIVYDVKTDEARMATYREINNRTESDILNSHIYDVFNQIKSNPKSKK